MWISLPHLSGDGGIGNLCCDLSRFLWRPQKKKSAARFSLWGGDLPIVTCPDIIQANHAISKPGFQTLSKAHVFKRAMHELTLPQDGFLFRSTNLT